VTGGAIWAVVASVATWVLVEWVIEISTAQREALEGITMLLATAVLFSVSYWLLSKFDVARWTAFVKGRMDSALAGGSGLALASVAFLAVYREGLETILFYEALLASADGRIVPIAAGMVVAGAALALLYVGIHRFGLRIPMRPFFAITSAVLYYMAFVFAGKGIAELQEGGWTGSAHRLGAAARPRHLPDRAVAGAAGLQFPPRWWRWCGRAAAVPRERA
jgi:high-affinity iron transporter